MFDDWIFEYGNDKNLNNLMILIVFELNILQLSRIKRNRTRSKLFFSTMTNPINIGSKLFYISKGNWNYMFRIQFDEIHFNRFPLLISFHFDWIFNWTYIYLKWHRSFGCYFFVSLFAHHSGRTSLWLVGECVDSWQTRTSYLYSKWFILSYRKPSE